MSPREVLVARENGAPYRLLLRQKTSLDARHLRLHWERLIKQGPSSWADHQWNWGNLEQEEQAFPKNSESVVLADEVETGAQKDILGLLITTGPHQPGEVALQENIDPRPLLWVEIISIAPSIRKDCPPLEKRKLWLKAIGTRLMQVAIERSRLLGCGGRIGLHADGAQARLTYVGWGMKELPPARHPQGGHFPVFFGDEMWANSFPPRKESAP